MKARFEFQTDKQYMDYLRIYFSGLAMQATFTRADAGSLYAAKKAVEIANALLHELENQSS